MIKKSLKIIIISAFLIFTASWSYAAVHTTKTTDGYKDSIYVGGNPDFYPIEYYNQDTGNFEGVMPDILKIISERTGLDFVYINGGGADAEGLLSNMQAEVISAYIKETDEEDIIDFSPILTYDYQGETKDIGFAFTKISSPSFIDKFKSGADTITLEEINRLLIKYSKPDNNNSVLVITMILFCIAFLTLSALLFIQIKHIKNKNKINLLTDAETGLGNLAYFKHHFENSLNDVTRSIFYIAYIVLDSSYLRSYHGATTFDDTLKYTAGVLAEYTRCNEFVARITENGFAFAFMSTNRDDAKERLSEILKRLNEYVDFDEKNKKLVFHSALYNLQQSDRNCEILLFNLRKNCNKIYGTDQQIIFCDVHAMNKIQEEKKITENIIKAFKNKEFKLYLQFIVDSKTKKITSAEALSRWDSIEKGLLTPGKYIGIMENDGLISRHDLYMFDLVCSQLSKWKNTPFKDISISCNFTRITLSEADFLDNIKNTINKYDFDKNKLIIEITEDAIEKNMENALTNISKCKELGFRVALDDLGSGYTSLINLCDYPIDIVKIDRDILLKSDKTKGKSLLSGIVELSHKLNLKVVCEGVETKEQELLVTQSQCDFIQGFYYSKPLPKGECENFIAEYHSSLSER